MAALISSILRALRVAGLVAAALVAGASPALAQQGDNDYYTSQSMPLLRTVEQYHLIPGEEKLRNRNYESAYGDFSFILRYFPNHPRALLAMVHLCSEWRSQHCLLDTVFEKAIAVRPNEPGTFVVSGIYLHRIKRYKEAIAAFERALALDPESMNAHYNVALTYVETRQYALANEHAQRAYALGATLPGLRKRLEKAGQWNPSAAPTMPPRADADVAAPADPTTLTPPDKD